MKYHKIYAPYKRDLKGKFTSEYASKEIEFLKDSNWIYTDKIDGTNVRVYYDGYDIEFKGRKDNSTLPKELINVLKDVIKVEKLEEVFGEKKVILYGEGYGGKIQRGKYNKEEGFILFDVLIGGNYLDRESVDEIASSLGLDSVKIITQGTIQDGIDYINNNILVEGLVGVPELLFLDRYGKRIIIKIKNKDFKTNQ